MPEAVAAHAARARRGSGRAQRPDRGRAGGARRRGGRGDARASSGSAEPGLARLIHAAYDLLELITFFTADRDNDACARSIARGSTAWDAAGKVHREIQEAFVRAEVVRWDELVDSGG